MNTQNNPLTVAVDIGTTKICVMAGKANEYGKLDVIAHGKVESTGVSRGVVSNIEKTVNAIKEAVQLAERRAGQKFKYVNVGIAGHHIKSLQNRGMITRDMYGDVITESDIKKLINEMYKMHIEPGHRILHVIPQEFTIDGITGILDPIGRKGIRLEANFHIITAQVVDMQNIASCIEQAGLKLQSLNLEPIASAEAVLSVEEKEEGVVLVDIGGRTTDISIFKDGILRHTAVIPFGGKMITKDIKEGCQIMEAQAENLKVKYGAALAELVDDDCVIVVPGLKGRSEKEITQRNLALIIQARVEEIFDNVIWEIQKSGYENQVNTGGIVVTGGGSQLAHIEKLIEYLTGMHCRKGVPNDYLGHGYDIVLHSPIYSTAIGLLLKGMKEPVPVEEPVVKEEPIKKVNQEEIINLQEEELTPSQSKKSLQQRFVDSIYTWFQVDPDHNLDQ